VLEPRGKLALLSNSVISHLMKAHLWLVSHDPSRMIEWIYSQPAQLKVSSFHCYIDRIKGRELSAEALAATLRSSDEKIPLGGINSQLSISL